MIFPDVTEGGSQVRWAPSGLWGGYSEKMLLGAKTMAHVITYGTPVSKIYNATQGLFTLLILMAQGAPGKPGRQVLKAEISEKAPRPQALIPATRNL